MIASGGTLIILLFSIYMLFCLFICAIVGLLVEVNGGIKREGMDTYHNNIIRDWIMD